MVKIRSTKSVIKCATVVTTEINQLQVHCENSLHLKYVLIKPRTVQLNKLTVCCHHDNICNCKVSKHTIQHTHTHNDKSKVKYYNCELYRYVHVYIPGVQREPMLYSSTREVFSQVSTMIGFMHVGTLYTCTCNMCEVFD